MPGPLRGLRVVEIASLAPAPFACTVLSDMGAEVLRVDRAAHVPADPPAAPPPDPLARGRRSVAVDLKHPDGVAAVLRLVERADVLVEGFRPGVCERLGLGPDVCLARNPRLVYGRLSGYGQDGPLAPVAGHDITYLAISGALWPVGPADAPPVPPLNYVADFGGGGMVLVAGVLAALWERERSGRGQVVDAAMVEGSVLLTAMLHGFRAAGMWRDQREGNLLDGAAPFYRCYTCADGRYVAVGALEPQFYAALLAGLGLTGADLPDRHDRAAWPALGDRLAAVFATRTRDEWAEVFAAHDACVAPVLSPAEAVDHPHLRARAAFVDVAGMPQPAPAPRLSRTPGEVAGPAPHPGQHTTSALLDWGFTPEEVDALRAAGAAR
ncbi:alpha-methylacyl-CoA racemase [Streptoalloteichus tenebrarius]|uniref:Alpha-methylacyl-CoA racemase n=1 Tax=Streptoalloteichus tenebrarius (strain ATCC 17920 / DSM 40477 / JCM 4838 / CBS 697.72 / NBRC 16177 / NCIMB 11028 / NRRL B-12390 / A12253. 1 / ISP 5477) TaxID=1933 RepID=A0ABT1HZ20_STRSD|nr:CaiB/BaiF CoA-transferase family protein [Streptoalloteichus tenebrarius]MCP2260739.1 alpha-methylacyl-CoA racemase [Streptoalloteichus tenebrarius]BFF03450.1 CaiB/BaiF CoA-transferase family protein [Streptoalloteichus tenebrarius]